mmetsp:Transcript_52651/g.78645  ORF Transcript_52651/g.78645 Transcript_52651/m.78645 type:complete len:96 (+) Transcript_52651:110-397(+)
MLMMASPKAPPTIVLRKRQRSHTRVSWGIKVTELMMKNPIYATCGGIQKIDKPDELLDPTGMERVPDLQTIVGEMTSKKDDGFFEKRMGQVSSVR